MADTPPIDAPQDSALARARHQLTALKASDAQHLEPVRLRYLEALCQRLERRNLHQAAASERLLQAVRDCQSDVEQQRENLATAAAAKENGKAETGNREKSESGPAARRLSPLSNLVAELNLTANPVPEVKPSPLASLMGMAPSQADGTTNSAANSDQPKPLRAMTQMRQAQGHQALEQRIRDAIERTPADAGPMNPHRLVSRAIRDLQTLSPDYLQRFAGYVDTLLALEKMGRKAP
ncbi:DUF2894 domain-containing protein [Marinobacter xestospongiae]|uniref:DUF2894 domain-containing protein n=1 Tax=Marinobacter xestospongiae TaxID=994319 RepID=A0ABU3W2P3_9GAMM|nr:DUF2894 domain-containing protein [Marinobacter xestospongiae]MDV2080815.1 DUF2894 domain-containing protein [Marinobacter xestospongiae]